MNSDLKSYGPNMGNLKLSLSKLLAGRNSVRTKGIGTKRGKLRLKIMPNLTKAMKLPPAFPSHQATGQFGNGGSSLS
jgi:hypothetical protein